MKYQQKNLGGHGGHCGLPPPTKYLADQITLFQPGESILSPPITAAPPPPIFFTFWHQFGIMHFKISDQLLEMTKLLNLLILQLYCIRPCCSFENGYIVQGIRSCTCTRNGIEMHQCNIYVHSMQILPTDCNFSIHIKYIIHSRKMRSLTS